MDVYLTYLFDRCLIQIPHNKSICSCSLTTISQIDGRNFFYDSDFFIIYKEATVQILSRSDTGYKALGILRIKNLQYEKTAVKVFEDFFLIKLS